MAAARTRLATAPRGQRDNRGGGRTFVSSLRAFVCVCFSRAPSPHPQGSRRTPAGENRWDRPRGRRVPVGVGSVADRRPRQEPPDAERRCCYVPECHAPQEGGGSSGSPMREHGTNAVGPPPDGEGFMDFRPASVRRCTKGLCRTLRAAGKSGNRRPGVLSERINRRGRSRTWHRFPTCVPFDAAMRKRLSVGGE